MVVIEEKQTLQRWINMERILELNFNLELEVMTKRIVVLGYSEVTLIGKENY